MRQVPPELGPHACLRVDILEWRLQSAVSPEPVFCSLLRQECGPAVSGIATITIISSRRAAASSALHLLTAHLLHALATHALCNQCYVPLIHCLNFDRVVVLVLPILERDRKSGSVEWLVYARLCVMQF